MKSAILYLIASAVFTVAGGAAGWYLASGHSAAGAHAPHAEAAPHADHAGHEGVIHLTPQAFKNAGIVVREIEAQAFTVAEHLPAMIAEAPQTEQPLTAPVAGIVLSVLPTVGQQVDADEAVVTILRDALPRPTLTLTADLLKPATEEYHRAKADLRKARTAQVILVTELARFAKFAEATVAGLPVLPQQNLINLNYEKAKVDQEVATLQTELRLHGLTEEQITRIENGDDVELNLQVWKSVLRRNGFWSEQADALLTALPKADHSRPWVIATIGELVTQDLLNSELIQWVAAKPEVAASFTQIAGLLLSGENLTSVQRLHELGALKPLITVRVPTTAPDWDVHTVHVKAGDRVTDGQLLLTLGNPRIVHLESRPVGRETVAVLAALENGFKVAARPLVPGSGPSLSALSIQGVAGTDDDHSLVRIVVANTVAQTTTNADGRRFRSWALRTGQRYMLEVPIKIMANVMVVPMAAVIENGPERIVYTRDGEGFRPVQVVVDYANHQVVVIGEGSELFPGDPVAVEGAFMLDLAAKSAGGAAVDPHAGHNH